MNRRFILTSLLALGMLSACSPAREQEAVFADSETEETASYIIGGGAVGAQEGLAKTTVQILTLDIGEDIFGNIGIRGVGSCTGTLIDKNIVLTAAHCTTGNPNNIFIYFSKDMPKEMPSFIRGLTKNPLVRRVSAGKVGDAWPLLRDNQEADWGDIALLKFDGTIPGGYKTAPLLPENQTLKAGEKITLAGFGWTNGLRRTATEFLRKVEVSILDPQASLTEMLLNTSQGKGACHGDSGGPAFVVRNGVSYVAGTTSRADSQTDPRGQCIGNVLYTKVQPYLAWIRTSIQEMQASGFKPSPIPQPAGM